jgi:hypothetical protein
MARHRASPSPKTFTCSREREYWHEAQDIAYGANVSIFERGGKSWLVDDDGERVLCDPAKPSTLWQETWWKLRELFPQFTHMWIGTSMRSKKQIDDMTSN